MLRKETQKNKNAIKVSDDEAKKEPKNSHGN